MRYFFHVENDGDIHIDPLGTELASAEAAKAHAVAMVRELVRDEAWSGWVVRVIDGRNFEVACVPVTAFALTR